MGVQWISYRRKSELQGILKEFGLDTEGTVEEMRSRLSSYASQPELPKAVGQRLAELEMTLGCTPTPDPKIRPRSPSPFPGEKQPGAGPSGATTSAEATGSTASPALPSSDVRLQVPPRLQMPGGTSEARTHDAFTEGAGPHSERFLQLGLADRLRKWGVFFSGGAADPLRFIEHLEDMVAVYRLDIQQQLMPAVAGLLTGPAADWFRVSGLHGATWEEFKREFLDFFLPPRYFQRLEDEIRARTQRVGEPFTTYLLSLRVMMRRAAYSMEQELDRLYDNLLPEYQLFTRRHEFTTLAQLTRLVTIYEDTKERTGSRTAAKIVQPTLAGLSTGARAEPANRGATEGNRYPTEEAGTSVDVRRACRNCAQEGHFSRECQNPRILFCWDCGRRGTRTLDCCRARPAIHDPPVMAPLRYKEGRIVAGIRIGDKFVEATIDTGATRSFISEAVARELSTAQNQRTILTRITLADGTQRDVTQALVVRVHLGQRGVTVAMLVLPTILDEIILGMDFLCEMQGRIECGTAQLQLEPNSSGKPPIVATTMRPAPPTTHERTAEAPPSNRNRPELPATCETAIRNNPFRRPQNAEQPTGAPSAPSRVKPRQPKAVSRPPPDDVSPSRDYLGGIAEPVVPAPVAKEPLDVPEETWVKQFLQEELSKFEGLTGVSHIAQHVITLRDNRPIKQRYYPKNPAMQKIINDQVDELLKDDRIEPSRSPHSAPIVLVGKKTGDVRMCVDYRQLNARSVPDAYPLPRINHILEKLRNAKYISTLDLKSGYWQIPMAEGSREYTAFTVPGRGLYHWKVMPFGLHSAPATFQRALDGVIGPDMEPHAFAYLDDIIVIGSSMKEHAANLREVLRRLREANLRLNKDKCSFFQKSLVYLGHVVSEAGIHTDPEKINAIKELAPPTNVKELRRCLGIASWYRRCHREVATSARQEALHDGRREAHRTGHPEALGAADHEPGRNRPPTHGSPGPHVELGAITRDHEHRPEQSLILLAAP
ncbi:hypothetical protein ACLKA7_000938 [Drosophila subpalustris]